MYPFNSNTGNFRLSNVGTPGSSGPIGIMTPSYGIVGFSFPGTTGTIELSGPAGLSGTNFKPITGASVVPATASQLQNFTYDSGRLVYTGAATRNFRVSGWFRTSDASNPIALIFKNGICTGHSAINDAGACAYVETIVSLAQNDYVELAGSLYPSSATVGLTGYQLMAHSI